MANYQYDEGGGMSVYFFLTFLSLVLLPLTFSVYPSSKKPKIEGCQCAPCIEQRERIRRKEKPTLLNPKLGTKATLTILGWVLFAFLVYKVSTTENDNKMYDPFEILGIRAGMSEKDIKSHYKKLSRKFHPDKVRLIANQTAESVASYFVDLTKAYKSLTDETIRKNWETYGHPDGRQEVSTGIAIPKWIVEGKNRFWVLVVYCILIGGFLPVIVSRWWFGNRIKTKDGVYTKSAEVFFKAVKEDSAIDDIFGCFGKVFEWEYPTVSPIDALENKVRSRLGSHYDGSRALTLLYAHLLRIEIIDPQIQKEQQRVLLQTPVLLSSLLNITMSRNWLLPTIAIMRLHAYITQALPPSPSPPETLKLAQMPGFDQKDVEDIIDQLDDDAIPTFLSELQKRGDERLPEVEKAARRWGRLELVDVAFKVIGERIVTPSALVQLVIKVRISPPTNASSQQQPEEDDVEKIKRLNKFNEEKDNAFLASRKDGEELTESEKTSGWAHAPYWPGNRKPSWWFMLADDKTSRIVVPPLKITDVPFSDPSKERNYRAYKIQFQVPQGVGFYTWKVYLVSDTFIGEDIVRDAMLQIEDPSALNADEQAADDEISDPDEDSLAGQMAAMRGGTVKKPNPVDESDEESSTDDDKEDGSGGSSDSD